MQHLLILSMPLLVQGVGFMGGFPVLGNVDLRRGDDGLAVDEAAELGASDRRHHLRLREDMIPLGELLGHRLGEGASEGAGGGA